MEQFRILLFDNDIELEMIIGSDKLMQKVERAENYKILLGMIGKNNYDAAIINPELCEGDVEAVVKLFLTRKVPVLVILDKYNEVEKIIDALSAGAFDYFQRPLVNIISETQKGEVSKDISAKIMLAVKSKDKIKIVDTIKESSVPAFDFRKSSKKIIIIGSSTGGPQSLEQIIPVFPKEIPGPIIVVQHMPQAFTKKLAERFDAISNVKVKEAEDGEELVNGVCYIAKGDYHLILKKNNDKKVIIALNQKERILGVRPCINVTMESAAKIYGRNVIGVILTGMGTDGTVGSKKIKENGGTIIVESEKTSIIYGMPKSVVTSGYYDAIIDLEKIPVAVLQILEV
jgi:two-component system, chemotaxis family, protein-glutamate methylesterase/glutaminase